MVINRAFQLYLLTLIIAPLAFGTVETWSLTFMESTVFLAAFLFFLGIYLDPRRPLRAAPGLIYILLLPGFFLIQLLPMPGPVLKFISPAAFELYGSTVGLVSPPTWLPISLNIKATLNEFFRFSAYAVFYYLTIQFTARRGRMLTTLYLVVFTGAFIALLAIVQKVTAAGLIYWFRASPGSNPMGPYIYRNQFAGYMEMIFPLTLCLFLWTRPAGGTLRSCRQRFIEFFSKPGVNVHTLLGVAATVIATAVFFSLSRGGIISLCLALLFMIIILNRRKYISSRDLLFILIPAVTMVFVSWFGWEPIIGRFLQIKTADGIYDGRFLIWQDVVPMVRDFLLTGSGAGSFATTFPAYQNMRFTDRIISHAHNDYLELLSSTGLIGTLLVGGFLFGIVRASSRMIGGRKDRFAVYLWAAALTGMVSIFLHSVTDFNFYNGANGLYFFTLCGLLVAGAAARMRPDGRSLLVAYHPAGRQLLVPIVAVTLLLLAGLFVNIRAMLAAGHFNAVRNISLNVNIPREKLLAIKAQADRAVRLDPLAARNFYLQANIASFLRDHETAATAYRMAIERQPLKGEYLQQYALFLNTGQTGIDPEPLIRAATLVNPVDPEVHLQYGNWLLARRELDRGFKQLQTGLTLNPQRLTGQLALLTISGFTGGELQAGLPDGIRYQLTLAQFLEQLGRLEEATEIYRQAEARSATGEELTANDYQTIANYYNRQKMAAAALRVTRQGVARFPDDARYRILLGDLLNRNGLPREAEDAFRMAVTLAPDAIEPLIMLASFLAAGDKAEDAGQEFQRAVKLLPRAVDLGPGHIRSIYNYYYRINEYDQALEVIKMGIRTLPGNLGIRVILGDAYLQMGKKLAARVAYQRVLTRDPGNSAARQRLGKMGVGR